MKMIKFVFIIAGFMAFFGQVHATPMPGPQFDYRTTDCSLLNEDIKINLSTNVVGAVICRDTAASPNIIVGTCHQGGRTTSRSVTVNTPAGCDTDTTVTCTGTAVSTTTGANMPFASTLAGTATVGYPSTNCDLTGDATNTYLGTLP